MKPFITITQVTGERELEDLVKEDLKQLGIKAKMEGWRIIFKNQTDKNLFLMLGTVRSFDELPLSKRKLYRYSRYFNA